MQQYQQPLFLFANDGNLTHFVVHQLTSPPSSIKELAQICHQAVYNSTNPNARVFTEFGLEVTALDQLLSGQSLVITNGDAFVPIQASAAGPLPDITIDSLLRDIYVDSERFPADNVVESGEFGALLDEGLQDIYGDWGKRDETTQEFPPVFDYLLKELKNSDDVSENGSSSVDPTSPASAVSTAASIAEPFLPTSPVTENDLFNELNIPVFNYTSRTPTFAPSHAIASSAKTSAKASSSTKTPPSTDTNDDDADSDDESHVPKAGSKKKGGPKRLSTHLAAEQRSRTRLRESIHELAMTLPSLSHLKTPSRAAVISAATETIRDQMAHNTQLQEENSAIKRTAQQLAEEAEKIRLSSLVTVEITDSNNQYVYVDRMWEIVTGFSKADVLGKAARDITGCFSCPTLLGKSLMIDEIIRGGNEWSGVIVSKRKNKQLIACVAKATPVFSKNGEFLQCVTTRKHFHLLNKDQAQHCDPARLETVISAYEQAEAASISCVNMKLN